MKKKLFSLMMMCMLALGAFAQYNEVGLGFPTTNLSNAPVNTYYNYSISQQIYTVAELGAAGNITSISFFAESGAGGNRDLEVYMSLTDVADYENDDPIPATAADLVFADTVTIVVGDWTTITLDAPFAYDGEHNIVVTINNVTGDYSSSTYFRTFSGIDGTHQLLYSSNDYDGEYDPETEGYTFWTTTKNVMRFGGLEQVEYPTTANLPTNSYYKFGLTQQIYTAAEIDSTDCDISGISFFNMGTAMTRNLDVYMVPVDTNAIDGWVPADSATLAECLAFSGEVTFASAGWTKIPMRVMNYDGSYNIAILVDDNTDEGMMGLNFLAMEDVVANSARHYYDDDSSRFNPDPFDMANIPGVADSVRPLVKWEFAPKGLVQIGDIEANTNYIPVSFAYYNYSMSQQIYTAQEIGMDGTITSLKYMFFPGDPATPRDITVYMKYTDKEHFTATDTIVPMTEADKVFQGTVTFVNNGGEDWTAINLSPRFEYDGEHNLLITVVDNMGTTTGSASGWFMTHYIDNMTRYVRNNSTEYDVTTPITGSTLGERNSIQLQFWYEGYDSPLDPDLYILDDPDAITLVPVTTLNLGFRPNGAWMRPASWNLYNMTGAEVTVRDHDFTPNPDYFSLVAPEVPFTMDVDGVEELYFTTDTAVIEIAQGHNDSLIQRQFVVFYDMNRSAAVWTIRATAYEPVENDVYELATALDADDLPYLDTLHVYDTAGIRRLYDNYQLLPEDTVPGLVNNDAVYKLTFDDDVLLNAYVYGENAKIALYTEDFYEDEFGIPGPDLYNTYNGPVIGWNNVGPAAYDAIIGDGTGSSGYMPMYGFYNYSITQQLYLASELSAAGMNMGDMSQIGFQAASNFGMTANNVKIWMANTTATEFPDNGDDWVETFLTDNMTLVFEGSLTTVEGWNMINIEDAGFAWDGESNIIIAVQRNNGSYTLNYTTWNYTSTPFTSTVIDFNDDDAYDMENEVYDPYYTATARANTRFVSGSRSATLAGNNNGYYHYNHNASNRNRETVELINEGWEDGIGDWTMVNCDEETGVSTSISAAHTGDNGFAFHWSDTPPQYLISPSLAGVSGTNLSFYYKQNSSYYVETFCVGYSTTTNDVSAFTFGAEVTATTEWAEYTETMPAGTKYIAIKCTSDDQYYLYVDDIIITTEEGGGGGDEPEPEPVVAGMDYDFEGGVMPSDWDANPDWYIADTALNTAHTPAKDGMSAFFDGTPDNDTADIALPAYDFAGYSELCFDYIATGTNKLDVLYGPSLAHLTSLLDEPLSSTSWKHADIDLSELGDIRSEYIIVFRHTGGTGVTGLDNIRFNNFGIADASIEGMPVEAGTYYLVVSSTENDFIVRIESEEMPCPEMAYDPVPADDADNLQPRRVDLTWQLGEYTTEYRLVFGTTYYCEEVLIDWTSDLAENYTLYGLYNNTNYFWRVDERNSECDINGEVWGFTTHLNVPENLRLEDESVFVGEPAVVLWDNIEDRTFRQYNIYVDGQLIGHTPTTYIPDQFLSYAIDSLGYNMNPGYAIQVSALYDEGESDLSLPLMVKVSGTGTITGYVYEQDGTTGIPGAHVIFSGYNEFGEECVYDATTNAAGRYTIEAQVSKADTISYFGAAACDGYQSPVYPIEGNPRPVVYNQTTQANFIMDEIFYPLAEVIAEYYPDITSDDEYVKVYWSMNIMSQIIEDFETGDFSQYDWELDATYPWVITDNNPYEGDYCMKSGNQQVLSSTSTMEVTVNIPNDGQMSFFGKISCESSFDNGYFYIDGVQKGAYTGESGWVERKFDITAGDHTFTWEYTEDYLISSGDDCFYVDYITFFRNPEPVAAGWHTYAEGEFDNAFRSNAGNCSWGYEYPTSLTSQYSGFNLTKVAVFSDDYYGAVGGNFTCNVYVGGDTPGAGTLASSITVDVPVGLGDWASFDLTTPVAVNGSQKLWVIWVENQAAGLGYPAGCTTQSSEYGDWWNNGGGDGWVHINQQGSTATWTMMNYFDNGRDVIALNPNGEVVSDHEVGSNLYNFVKGEEVNIHAECVNPNAQLAKEIGDMAVRGTRAFHHYRIYRTNCYNDGPYTEENTVLLASDWPTDTVYIDANFDTVSPGVYKWGVSRVYRGNRDLTDPLGRESEIVWSNCLDKDMYLVDGVEIQVLLNSADDPDGALVSFTNLNEAEQALYPVDDVILDETGYYNWELFRKGEYNVTVSLEGYETISQNVSIWDATSLRYVMIELLNPLNTLYVSRTGWAMWPEGLPEGGGVGPTPGPTPGPSGDFTEGFENGLGDWTMVDCNSYTGVSTSAAHTGDNGFAFHWSTTPPQYLISPNLAGVSGTNLSFYYKQNSSYYVETFCVGYSTTTNEVSAFTFGPEITATNDWTEYSASMPAGTKYIAIKCTSDDQYYLYVDDFTYGAARQDRHIEGYKVLCESIDHEPIFNENTIHNFCQLDTDALVEGQQYICKVAIIYSTGQSDWVEATWEYEPCEHYADVDVEGESTFEGNYLSWNGGTPGPGPQPDTGDEFTVDFEAGMPAGWTTIDADGDGYNWQEGTDTGHNSTGYMESESYINYVGALNPDNYLVSPMVNIGSTSTFSFYACAQDASYAAEHFGVGVSTDGTNFTMLQEWTLTAKSGAKAPRGMNAQGNWYQYTVDLSAYAGQQVKIAIRHFNCTDWFRLNVDDVVLSNGAKNRDVILSADFEAGLPTGWAIIDADGDGNNWQEGTDTGHNSTGYMESESYINYVGALNPDNYLVTPQVNLGGTFSFWACAQDADYAAEHFGVAVSTGSQTSAADFTMVQEWTLTAKSGAKAARGMNAQGSWYQYTVDLSAYAGQTGYIAIRHFNCTDWFRLNVDDVELTGSSAPVPPTPLEGVLGYMIFSDGEWVAELPATATGYLDEGEYGDHDYLVRVIYDGTAILPSNNYYYAMSCGTEVYVEGELTCEPGDPIRGSYLYDEDGTFGALISWGEQILPISDWLYYDNGVYDDAIGTGGSDVYWGIMIPSTMLAAYDGTFLTKVALYEDASLNTEPITVNIYFGGTSAPQTLVHTQTVTPAAADDFHEINLNAALPLDVTQNLWITVKEYGTYPATGCTGLNEPNGRWISLDGVEWMDVLDAGLNYTWLLRGFVTNEAKGVVSELNPIEFVGGGNGNVADLARLNGKDAHKTINANLTGRELSDIVAYNIYRSADNVVYDLIATIPAYGEDYYEYFDETAAGTYYYQVTAVYDNGCESEPAISEANPLQNYVVVEVTGIDDNMNKVALYPNPTHGLVKIEAAGMRHITVVSVLGQVVYDTELSADEYELNMAQWNAGVYMVRIATENGVSTQRVTVVR